LPLLSIYFECVVFEVRAGMLQASFLIQLRAADRGFTSIVIAVRNPNRTGHHPSTDATMRVAVAIHGEQMKVSDLQGPLLDYWVARVAQLPKPRVDDGFCWIEEPACDGDAASALEAAYAPSTDWSHGGPVIEREHICIGCLNENEWGAGTLAEAPHFHIHGATLLIAAMRFYVARQYGEHVPDEAEPGA
jgi:hypothetical protein